MIYFLRCEQDGGLSGRLVNGHIKIGTTVRLSVRLKQIAAEIGHIPTVLAVFDGAYAEEAALHRRFSGSRSNGEWFRPDADLLLLIETEGRPWDVTDEARPMAAIKLDADVLRDARIVCAITGGSLSTYLSGRLRPFIALDKEAAIEREKLDR
jgi:hypothetical protein